MHFFFFHPIKRSVVDEPVLVTSHELPRNTSEGSEFLDDAIRMEDLSLTHTEESVAAGSPLNLL
ncbi:hypothetical protein Q4E93_33760 [Flavitalea sp. BT771]|uniref:hypothetical protein n=1 Tax=Flavitalea sp. BT771 TaxID=3063329 RepID=UPI0026E1865A|nr:hypothetical protein [Flavitalea sp. BT771]MDO6435629.1 hypothetical protein [Flavitalea sp. BT771]MDV6224529.1 hypothetical protein [Flavitalea sp. BT771]